MLISWKSTGKKITISPREAEYIARTEMPGNLIIINRVIEFLEMMPEMPIDIKMDNAGEKLLAKNEQASQKTKDIDVK